MKEDPFLFTYNAWSASLNHRNGTRHHTIPRSRPNLVYEVGVKCGLPTSNYGWNLVKVSPDIHALWHHLTGVFSPWEVLILLEVKGENLEIKNHWQAFAWLMIFGGMSAKQASQIIAAGSENSLSQICFTAVPVGLASAVVLENWTTPHLRDYTLVQSKR